MWKAFEDVRPIALGHAADYADHQVRSLLLPPAQLSEARPDLLLGVLADRASVVNDDIRLLAVLDRLVSLGAQLPQDQLAVEHVHLAAKGFQIQLSPHEMPRILTIL